MKLALLLLLASQLWAQGALDQSLAGQLATRMLQLMESAAVPVPGLVQASEVVKQSAQVTLMAMQRTPGDTLLTYRFMNQVTAYLALADSIPRPSPFPAATAQQDAELREYLQRVRQYFEAILQSQGDQKHDSDSTA